MPSAKQELERICSELNSGKLAKVTIFRERDFSKEDGSTAEGYVFDQENPARIYLRKSSEYSYRDLLLTLFHELGHVYDKKRYKGCKRLKLCDKYYFTDSEFAKAKEYPKYIKFAFLHTEYIAEKHVPWLIKKYKLDLDKPFTETYINISNYQTLKIKKYQLIYGKKASRRLKRLWWRQLKNNPKKLTIEYIKDMEKI